MKKEKGFTLIELLAVIVILAILMVVAVPKILNVIENSRKSAAESSIKLVKDAIKTQVASGNIVGNNLTSDESGCYLFNFDDQNSGNAKELNVKNKENITGTIKYCNGTFSEDTLKFNGIQSGVKDNDNKSSVICKRATTLHTEECEQTNNVDYCSGAGYTANGSKGTITITYGNLGTSGTLTSGDAFDCDVNGDGVYDENTERFYYASDYYNTKTKEFESDTAVLIYYNNVSGGKPSNSTTYAYDASGENWHGPVTALEQLPSTSEWKNVSLKSNVRAITNENGKNETDGGMLPDSFSYKGKVARLLTVQEINNACGITLGKKLDNCNYLMENTDYSNESIGNGGYWVENPCNNYSDYASIVSGIYYAVAAGTVSRTWDTGVRPAIEVLKSNISY